MFLTIFTPTYNRQNLLIRLYNSLKEQYNRDFEWLIIDDGSRDHTKQIVEDLMSDKTINIRYIFQENAGKHVAFNRAIKEAKGDFFICVDSDDLLKNNAIKELEKHLANIKDESAGIITLKSTMNGDVIGGKMPDSVEYTTLYKLATIYHCGAERTLVYRTKILQKYCFPVVKNEKFMTECVLYDQIDQDYEMKIANIVTTVCEYQEDGLSSNLRQLQIKNPMGTAIFYEKRISLTNDLKEKMFYKIRAAAFKVIARQRGNEIHLDVFEKLVGNIISKYYYFHAR